MELETHPFCCGIQVLGDFSYADFERGLYKTGDYKTIRDDTAVLMSLRNTGITGTYEDYDRSSAIVFTDVARGSSYGNKLAAFIKRRRLGPITETRLRSNKRHCGSNQPLKHWVWHFNAKKLQAIFDKLPREE